MPAPSITSAQIKQWAREQGFDLAGVAGVEEHPELAKFEPWIDAGRHGEMEYLEARNDRGALKRSKLQNVAPWARSVVVCAVNYNAAAPYSTHAGTSRQGWISRYAWSDADYHDVLLPRLRTLESAIRSALPKDQPFQSWCYVDTGPIIERVFAKYAGVGWIGKNTCLINEKLGSWLFLGVMLTSLELQPDLPAPDRCGSCTRCLDACPTQAFPGPHQLDATRCIAYLTIEKRGAIPEDLRSPMGRHVFGCDICQDVCPWNRKAPVGSLPDLQSNPNRINPALDWLAEMTPERFREIFRKSPVRRTKFNGIRRNVAIAIGNSDDATLLKSAESLAQDEDPIVAEHGRWAARRLRKKLHGDT